MLNKINMHHQINKEQLFEQFDSLLAFECSYWIFPVQTTNREQRIITKIDKEYIQLLEQWMHPLCRYICWFQLKIIV